MHLGRLILVGLVAAAAAAGLAAWLSSGRLVQPFTRRVDDLTARVDDVLTAQRQLLADTSHELRTPLTTVRGNLELLDRDLPAAERAEILAESREEVDRMSRLVRDLLILADSTSGELTREQVPLRLDLLVHEVVDRVVGADAARVGIEAEPVVVLGNEERLRQLIGNLVQNALRHASAAPAAVVVRVRRQPPVARLEVLDDGPGVPPDSLERIFDRFYRLDRGRSRAQGGTGLGLAIVRHVATEHGGRAWAANRSPGPGALFTVELPAEPSWSDPADEPEGTEVETRA
jgi:signal transduction histidine kinase